MAAEINRLAVCAPRSVISAACHADASAEASQTEKIAAVFLQRRAKFSEGIGKAKTYEDKDSSKNIP
jgi:hypothetical protein